MSRVILLLSALFVLTNASSLSLLPPKAALAMLDYLDIESLAVLLHASAHIVVILRSFTTDKTAASRRMLQYLETSQFGSRLTEVKVSGIKNGAGSSYWHAEVFPSISNVQKLPSSALRRLLRLKQERKREFTVQSGVKGKRSAHIDLFAYSVADEVVSDLMEADMHFDCFSLDEVTEKLIAGLNLGQQRQLDVSLQELSLNSLFSQRFFQLLEMTRARVQAKRSTLSFNLSDCFVNALHLEERTVTAFGVCHKTWKGWQKHTPSMLRQLDTITRQRTPVMSKLLENFYDSAHAATNLMQLRLNTPFGDPYAALTRRTSYIETDQALLEAFKRTRALISLVLSAVVIVKDHYLPLSMLEDWWSLPPELQVDLDSAIDHFAFVAYDDSMRTELSLSCFDTLLRRECCQNEGATFVAKHRAAVELLLLIEFTVLHLSTCRAFMSHRLAELKKHESTAKLATLQATAIAKQGQELLEKEFRHEQEYSSIVTVNPCIGEVACCDNILRQTAAAVKRERAQLHLALMSAYLLGSAVGQLRDVFLAITTQTG